MQDKLSLSVEAKAENLAVVRARAESYARGLGASQATIDAIKTIVSEACTNAVCYAYEQGEDGTLDVTIQERDGGFRIRVEDHGRGLLPDLDRGLPSLGMGLPIISALSQRIELRSERGGGTRIEAQVRGE